jgi:HPt (histidine-containing phosphotransfer) domain-containing protein
VEIDEFAQRLARIRRRFAAALPEKLDDSFAALPKLAGANADSIETLAVTHRKLHEICGIAPSIGFDAIGTAARAAETVLREPAKAKRPLKTDELAALRTRLEDLRAAIAAVS